MVVVVLAVAAVTSCIKNDTPLPTVKGTITDFMVEGQKSVVIDSYARHISIELVETIDPRQVKVTEIVLGENGMCELEAGQHIDLSSPITVMVKTNAEYDWTISATQTIERRFVIEEQVGEAYIEVQSRKAFAYVPRGTDLTKVRVTDLKLGPGEFSDGITTISPNLVGDYFRISETSEKHRTVEVSYRGITEEWSLFVTEADTQLNTVAPFAHKVYLVGYGKEGLINGFQYKKAEVAGVQSQAGDGYGSDEWITVPDADVTHDKGVFWTWIERLEAGTEYVVRAFSGDAQSVEQRFVTEVAEPLPSGDFEQWHSIKKSTITGEVSLWNPWARRDDPAEEKANKWWDTGNQGVVTLGNSNSVPAGRGTTAGHDDLTASPANPDGVFAYLKTEFVGIGGLGKIAGGNIYLGRYFGTSGTNGMCDMGIPWYTRPTRLKGWYQYYPQIINDVGTLHADQKEHWRGTVDSLNITVALWSMQPGDPYQGYQYQGEVARGFVVNTNPKEFRDLSKETPGVIAFGNFATNQTQSSWAEFDIEFDYYNYDPLPENTVLIIMATPSKSSNYFTAARGSLMYLDEVTLDYD
jgi:hypothetical protein